MGYLLPILIALGSLGGAEMGLDPLLHWPWGVLLLAPLCYVMPAVERRAALRGQFKRAAAIGALARFAPVLLQYVAIGVFGWMEALERWFGHDLSLFTWPHPAMLLALAPYVVYTVATIDAEGRMGGLARGSREVLRSFQLRMFMTGLGPIAAYVLLAGLVGWNDLLRVGVQEVSLWSLLFTAALGVAFVIGLPLFLRRTWDTQPMEPGPQRDLLQRVAELANFGCRELLVWRTGNMMANAAIVGLFPGSRRVFFTDALLAQTGPRQLAAVYAHEIGHAKRWHVLFFLVCSLAYFVGLEGLLEWIEPEGELSALAWFGGGALLWFKGFGWLSRRIELDADLFSLELLRDGIGITSALQMVGASAPNRHSWRHFSPQARIAFLNRAALDPAVGVGLRRRLRRVLILGSVLLVVGGIWRFSSYAGTYATERGLVDLRLGRYQSAVERLAEASGELAGEYLELANLAVENGLGDFREPSEALQRLQLGARESLEQSDLEAAAGWLALASYLGDREAAAAANWLIEREQGAERTPPTRSGMGTWDSALSRALGEP